MSVFGKGTEPSPFFISPGTRRMKMSLCLTALLASAFTVPTHSNATEPAAPDPVRISMVQTLFHDVPTPIVNLLTPPFKSLMKDFTGLNGAPAAGGDAFEIAKNLMEDKTHLGVLHGVEYAWVAAKYPEIKPLMIAVSKHHALKAHLMVRDDCPCGQFIELKGKDLAVPFRAREHLRLFVEKQCRVCAQCDPKSFFTTVTKPSGGEAALDDVLTGKSFAAVVDTISLETYAELKPGCYKRLKAMSESDPFPTAVIVYRQGALSDATLEKFRKGMISANQNPRGRDLMSMWKLSGFEAVPANYEEMCANIMRAYPAPVPAAVVSRPVVGDRGE
jgi:ABC-type phosphate/phosphonate transport system substrate-binding protein